MAASFREDITVEVQQKDKDSILNFYKKLIAIRKEYPVVAKGEISFLETEEDKVLIYQRSLGEQQLIVLCNLDKKKQEVKINKESSSYQILLENYQGRELPLEGLYTMEPYELMVIIKE